MTRSACQIMLEKGWVEENLFLTTGIKPETSSKSFSFNRNISLLDAHIVGFHQPWGKYNNGRLTLQLVCSEQKHKYLTKKMRNIIK